MQYLDKDHDLAMMQLLFIAMECLEKMQSIMYTDDGEIVEDNKSLDFTIPLQPPAICLN